MRLFILFLLGISPLIYGQNEIMHFSTENGLPHDLTYEIFQDKDGFIWIATDNGIVKYDGQNFKVLDTRDGLRSNFVIAIDQLEDETIVLGTWGGGIQFIKNNEVQTWNADSSFGLKINNIESSGSFLFSSYGYRNIKINLDIEGLTYQQEYVGFQNDKWKPLSGEIEPNDPLISFSKVHGILFGHRKPFFGSDEERPKSELLGIFKQENKNIKWVFPFLKDFPITALGEANKDMVAVTSSSLIVFSKDGIKKEYECSLNGLVPIKVIGDSYDGFYILAQDEIGFKYAFYFNPKNENIIDLRSEYGIKSTLSDFLLDHENNLWITTFGEGVYLIKQKSVPFIHIEIPELKSSIVKGIKQKNDSIFILTNDQLIAVGSNKKYSAYALKGFGKNLELTANNKLIVSSIKLDKNIIQRSNFEERYGFLYKEIEGVGKIIIQDSIFINDLKIEIPESHSINDIAYYRDTLYLGTNMGLSYVQDLDTNPSLKFVESELIDKTITSFQKQGDSLLWIGSNQGLFKKDDASITNYTIKDGMINNQVNSLYLDQNHKLWIGTQKGVSVFDNKVFYNLSNNTGLASTYVSAILEDTNYGIWLGGNNAITYIDAIQNLSPQSPPRINVKKNNNSFEYAVISFNSPKTLSTQYRINEGSWITSSTQDILDFSDYKKGNYTFRLRSKKENSDWGYSEIFNFKVNWVWYRNPIYLGLLFMLTLGVFGLIVRWRLKLMKNRNTILQNSLDQNEKLQLALAEVRNNIAKDFHDDMGNKLARISLLTRMLRAKPETAKNTEDTMDQIITDADELYKGTRDFIFSLSTESNLLEEFVTYLSDFGSELFENTETSFETISNFNQTIQLPPYWTRQLLFIFKEALVNVYKHAKATKVVLDCKVIANELQVVLSDNGKGVDLTSIRRKSGLLNMEERARRLNSKLHIESAINKGTTIKFTGTLDINKDET